MLRRTIAILSLALLAGSSRATAGDFLTGEHPVPDQYIVVLKPGVAHRPDMPDAPGLSVAQVASGLAMFYGGRVEKPYEHAIQGFHLSAKESQARALAADRRVAYVEQNQYLFPFTTQASVHWGLDRIDERDLPRNNHYTYSSTGSGVNVYVIDTGIADNSLEFGTRKVNAFTTVQDSNGNPAHGDCNGHGTDVAKLAGGAISGAAKSVKLHAVRIGDICGCGGATGGQPRDIPLTGSSCGLLLSDVLAGINWVAGNRIKPAVANMSFGGAVTQSLDDATVGVINSGVTAVVAAGNNNISACDVSPARVGQALTVGASDINDARALFSFGLASNTGPCLDLFAPGKDVDGFSGTSAAAPLVAGAAAQYLQTNTTASPATVASYIVNNSTTGRLTNIGTGSPNRLLFVPPGGTEIDNPPTASFTCSCGGGRTCSFTSTATDDFAIISCKYIVDYDSFNRPIYRFGCGTVTYTYSYSGPYTVDLQVTDDGNQVSSFATRVCS